MAKNFGRGKRIRTSGPCLPKTVLYQAELFPDRSRASDGGPRQERAYRERFPGWQAGNRMFIVWSWLPQRILRLPGLHIGNGSTSI